MNYLKDGNCSISNNLAENSISILCYYALTFKINISYNSQYSDQYLKLGGAGINSIVQLPQFMV